MQNGTTVGMAGAAVAVFVSAAVSAAFPTRTTTASHGAIVDMQVEKLDSETLARRTSNGNHPGTLNPILSPAINGRPRPGPSHRNRRHGALKDKRSNGLRPSLLMPRSLCSSRSWDHTNAAARCCLFRFSLYQE